MIVDAHHHLWTADYAWLNDPALAPIRRDYTVDDLRRELTAAGVDRAVLVEAGRCDYDEGSEFLELALNAPEIVGVVIWGGFADPELGPRLAAQAGAFSADKLVGVRDQVQGEADPDYLSRPDVLDSLREIADFDLAVELVIRADQLPAAAVAASAVGRARFVLDHLGKPPIAAGQTQSWAGELARLADCPNVSAKLSGLVTEADWAHWTVEDLRPYVQVALELFGPQRLLWGSDWPVVNLAGGYQRWLDAARSLVPAVHHEAVFGANAAAVYRWDVR